MANVELRNITKQYGAATVVSDLTLQIPHGELVALLGPSGCGKTTTLQMLAGFVDPTGGDILVGGRSVRDMPAHRRNIGVVFQSYALFPHLTVFENVAFGLRMRKLQEAAIRAKVCDALSLVQLTGMEERNIRALSGGQQQRVALARALVIEPELLLLDEPLSNLDANLREQMRFEIREIQRRIGITTVFVTHDQSEAMAVADRLVVMCQGVVRQVGTARDVYQRPADLFVAGFIGQANLLGARVESQEADLATLTLEPGAGIQVRTPQALQVGEQVTLALRHELLALAEAPAPGLNQLKGRIERMNYLGAQVLAVVRCGATTVTALLPSQQVPWQEGQEVWVQWAPATGLVFH
jgi:putative spermidine/putrescine transport system ATP-binding protein